MNWYAIIPIEDGKTTAEVESIKKRLSTPDPAPLHITLRFVPDIEEDDLQKLSQAVNRAASLTGPFYLRLDEVGKFPEGVSYVGIQGSGELRELQRNIDAFIRRLGFPKMTYATYTPHITLSYEDKDLMAATEQTTQPATFLVDTIYICTSEKDYDPIEIIQL